MLWLNITEGLSAEMRFAVSFVLLSKLRRRAQITQLWNTATIWMRCKLNHHRDFYRIDVLYLYEKKK